MYWWVALASYAGQHHGGDSCRTECTARVNHADEVGARSKQHLDLRISCPRPSSTTTVDERPGVGMQVMLRPERQFFSVRLGRSDHDQSRKRRRYFDVTSEVEEWHGGESAYSRKRIQTERVDRRLGGTTGIIPPKRVFSLTNKPLLVSKGRLNGSGGLEKERISKIRVAPSYRRRA